MARVGWLRIPGMHGIRIDAVATGHDVVAERDVADGTGHRADMPVFAHRRRKVTGIGNAAVRGLQRGDTGECGGTPHRNCHVASDADRGQAGRNHRRFAARRTARGALQIPRIIGAASEQIVALGPRCKFGNIGFRQRTAAGCLEACHRSGILGGDVPGEQPGAALTGNASGIERVLDGEGDAMQRAQINAAGDGMVGGVRALQRGVGHQGHQRIDLRVHGVDTLQVGLDHFPRR